MKKWFFLLYPFLISGILSSGTEVEFSEETPSPLLFCSVTHDFDHKTFPVRHFLNSYESLVRDVSFDESKRVLTLMLHQGISEEETQKFSDDMAFWCTALGQSLPYNIRFQRFEDQEFYIFSRVGIVPPSLEYHQYVPTPLTQARCFIETADERSAFCYITGETSAGKTLLAIEIIRMFKEICEKSATSRQIIFWPAYNGLKALQQVVDFRKKPLVVLDGMDDLTGQEIALKDLIMGFLHTGHIKLVITSAVSFQRLVCNVPSKESLVSQFLSSWTLLMLSNNYIFDRRIVLDAIKELRYSKTSDLEG